MQENSKNLKQEKLDDIHGWVFIDKPEGITSFAALNYIKKVISKGIKVGHGGTLDPMAQGILPVAIGEATKTLDYVLNKDKIYEFTVQLGEKTSTADKEGEIVATSDKIPEREDFERIIKLFIGNIKQIPPKYSAIKINGERAYSLARKGVDFTIKERDITIHSLSILKYDKLNKSITFKAKVSKGTYIRSLAEDIVEKLGVFGHIIYLRRISICLAKEIVLISLNKRYNIKEMIINNLISIEDMLDDISAYLLTKKEAKALLNGDLRNFNLNSFDEGKAKALYENKIIALLEKKEQEIKILRVFNKQIKQLT